MSFGTLLIMKSNASTDRTDYGFFFKHRGASCSMTHHFPVFPVTHVTALGPNAFTTFAIVPFPDKEFAVSLGKSHGSACCFGMVPFCVPMV